MIPTKERYVSFGYNIQVGLNIPAGNIRIYHPLVFFLRYGPNQSYSPEYGLEYLSSSSKWR